jgi:hypothetical protein
MIREEGVVGMTANSRRCLLVGALLVTSILVLPSQGSASKYDQEAEIQVVNETYVTIRGLCVGDWDNDGDTELLTNYDYYVGSGKPELVAYVYQNGIGYVEERRIPDITLRRTTSTISPSVQLIVSDIDGDGMNEVIFPGGLNGTRGIHVLSVTPSSYIEELSILGDFKDIAVGDMDGDKQDELVGVTGSDLIVYSVNSSGYSLIWSAPTTGNLLRIGNADMDSYNEIVLGTDDVDIEVYGFDGSTYGLEGSGSSSGYLSMGIGMGDFDSDGDPEILRVGYHGVVVIYGQVGGNWIVEDNWTVRPNDTPRYAISGDSDGDSIEEIIIAYGNFIHAESFQIYKYNVSTSTYELDWTSGSLKGWGASLYVGDPDVDGHPELITGSRSQGIVRIFSTPNGSPLPRPPTNPMAVLSGDNSQNVTLSWDLSLDDDGSADGVKRYDIYRNTSFDSQGLGYVLHDTVPNGTGTYTDVLAGEGNVDSYFYIICAVNTTDSTSCAKNQVAKFTRPLPEGQGLISVPLIQFDESIERVLQTVRFDKAWTYVAFENMWKSYATFKPYKGDLKTINHRMGVWVNVIEDSNLTVAGLVPWYSDISLNVGWNLVGYPSFDSNFVVGEMKAAIGAMRAEGFDASAPPYFLRALSDGEILETGYGYWVHLDSSTVWTVTNY